jgi:hypothetical protein
VAGIINALVNYKLSRISRRRFIFLTIIWLIIFVGLLSARSIYEFLFSNNLTKTEPLSLFDVMQITGIVILFFLVSRNSTKVETLERKVQDLHQELAIRLSASDNEQLKKSTYREKGRNNVKAK